MLFKVFKTQWEHPVKGDWVLEVKENMIEFGMSMSLDEIKRTSKSKFKHLVKVKATEWALESLLEEKEKHSKMKDLFYSQLKIPLPPVVGRYCHCKVSVYLPTMKQSSSLGGPRMREDRS